MTELDGLTVAVLGGTGPQGRGLARRFAMAGIPVVVGSRDPARAAATAAALAPAGPMTDPLTGMLTGMGNAEAAAAADVVVVAVPWEGHGPLLRDLAPVLEGKVVVDCVNPLGFDSRGAYALPVPEGSAAQQAAALLPKSTVVAAFHHVSAVHLEDPERDTVPTDVLVLGEDREATDLVQALADRIPGMKGVYGGRLRNAHQVEGFTANLISINRRYRSHSGLRVTDI